MKTNNDEVCKKIAAKIGHSLERFEIFKAQLIQSGKSIKFVEQVKQYCGELK